MDDGAEFTGRSVEDAVAVAAEALGADRENLLIEVISRGSRGVFGLGAEEARIRAAVKGPGSAAQPSASPSYDGATERRDGAADSLQAKGIRGEAVAVSTRQQEIAEVELADNAAKVLRDLLGAMGFEASVSISSPSNPIILAVNGENLGVLIGRRGDNLSALQFMVNLILSKNRRQWPRIVIDVENYRSRREDSLKTLATRVAYRVARDGRPFTLEAMPASDRRVIHLCLSENPDIETYSIGMGIARRVVIAPRNDSGYRPSA